MDWIAAACWEGEECDGAGQSAEACEGRRGTKKEIRQDIEGTETHSCVPLF